MSGVQLGKVPRAAVVAVRAVVVAAVGEGQVHAIRSRRPRRERHGGLEIQHVDGTCAIRTEQLVELEPEGSQVALDLFSRSAELRGRRTAQSLNRCGPPGSGGP